MSMNFDNKHQVKGDNNSFVPVDTRHKRQEALHIFYYILIESMMGLRPRQGNLRLVFRLYSLIRGLPSIRLK